MAVTIMETGHIDNEAGPKDNPRELEYFEHTIQRIIPDNHEIIQWYIEGDVPEGISIDSDGVISGTILGMWDQPSCVPKTSNEFVELDGRNWDNHGRYINNTYDFTFNTSVDWVMTAPPYSSGTDTKSHTITLVRDFDGDAIMFAKFYLETWDDGSGNSREPYHCVMNPPSNETFCSRIGGEWDSEKGRCSIMTPQEQSYCEAVGGVWENKHSDGEYRCNLSLIDTQEKCEYIGGTWKHNELILDGVVYTDYLEWLMAFFEANPDIYDGKYERLKGIIGN